METITTQASSTNAAQILHDLKRSTRKLKLILDELTLHQSNPVDPQRLSKLKNDYGTEIENLKNFWQSSCDSL